MQLITLASFDYYLQAIPKSFGTMHMHTEVQESDNEYFKN